MTDESIDKDWARFCAKRVTNELAYLMNKYKLKSGTLAKFPVDAFKDLTRLFYLKICDKKQYLKILEEWFVIFCVPKKEEKDEEVCGPES